jgi:molecular chaperone DnaK
MGTAIYAQTQASASEDTTAAAADETANDDEVVDAEIVDEDKPQAGEGGAA